MLVHPHVLALRAADPEAPTRAPAAPGVADVPEWHKQVMWFSLIGCLMFNWVLTFVNTHAFRTSQAVVIGTEVLLIAVALIVVATRPRAFVVVWGLFMVYLGGLALARMEFDPKIFRDLLIPVVFYLGGRIVQDPRVGDSVVSWSIGIVLVVGIVEWAITDVYLQVFNILQYYIARGSVTELGAETVLNNAYGSSNRFGGRSLFPILGDHRVSSVFLEAVSLGNFGAICFLWLMLRNVDRPLILALKGLPLIFIMILGDARFGVMMCVLIGAFYYLAPFVWRSGLIVAPFLLLIFIAAWVWLNPNRDWDNGFVGRILLSGQLMTQMNLQQVFGIETVRFFIADSGYGYVIAQFGIFGLIALWLIWVYLPVADLNGWRFKVMASVYLAMLLIVSSSNFSIKTAAMFWFLAGLMSHRTETKDKVRITDPKLLPDAARW